MVPPEDLKTGQQGPRLTPLDVHNKEFHRVFRGYDEDEVDEFLDLVVMEFERLVRESEEMHARIADLEARLEHYKGLEETLKNAIVLAQKTADQIRESASKEASAIVRQAQLDAQKIRDEAKETLQKSLEEVERNKNLVLKFRAEVKALFQSNLEMLDKGVDNIIRDMRDSKIQSTQNTQNT